VRTDKAGGAEAKYGHPLLRAGGSIFWNRSFRKLEGADQKSIDDICDSVDVNFLVTGHTVHETIKAYGNRIFDIDVGMTKQYGESTPQALMFRNDGIVGFGVDGSETRFARW
jgi:hypothetical protein